MLKMAWKFRCLYIVNIVSLYSVKKISPQAASHYEQYKEFVHNKTTYKENNYKTF